MTDFRTKLNTFLFQQPEIESTAANAGLLLARIYAGLTIMSAGLDKIPLPAWMIDQVTTVGFPFPTFFAWLACFTEFGFGLLLTLGLLTRLSGLMLAFTMGVAAFGYHNVLPLVDIHIAQHYVWLFIVFAAVGAGKYSLDALIRKPGTAINTQWAKLAVPALIGVFSLGLFLEFTRPQRDNGGDEELVISSINIPGSFNNWDPASNMMTQLSDTEYAMEVAFENPGIIEFKFTANKSWDVNLGVPEAIAATFPVSGAAALDGGNTTQNIRAYIPAPGTYQFMLNSETYAYSLDSLATR